MIESLVVSFLSALLAGAPQVIDAIRGSASNEEAIEKARKAAREIDRQPVTGALDDYERKITGG